MIGLCFYHNQTKIFKPSQIFSLKIFFGKKREKFNLYNTHDAVAGLIVVAMICYCWCFILFYISTINSLHRQQCAMLRDFVFCFNLIYLSGSFPTWLQNKLPLPCLLQLEDFHFFSFFCEL